MDDIATLALAQQKLRRMKFFEKYHNNRAAFARDCIDWSLPGWELTDYQYNILDKLDANYYTAKVAVMGPRGMGKSTVSSVAIVHFAICMEVGEKRWKVVTTASVMRQLKEYLWPEIRTILSFVDWSKIPIAKFREDKEILKESIDGKYGRVFMANSDNAGAIEGAHAPYLMHVFDEAKEIKADIFEGSDGAFSNAGSDTGEVGKQLVISTPPLKATGKFVDIMLRKPGYEHWTTVEVELEDTLRANRLSKEWVEQKKTEWGEEDPRYISRVLGKIPLSATGGVIPEKWYRLANERASKITDWGPITAIGVDIADQGEDISTLALRHEMGISEVQEIEKNESNEKYTMKTASRIIQYVRRNPGVKVVIDANGVGSGVAARVQEIIDEDDLDAEVIRFIAQERAEDEIGDMWMDKDRSFYLPTKRDASWWKMREILDPESEAPPAIVFNDDLKQELITPDYDEFSGGKIKIESKKSLRKADRLGRSTNYADAVIQAFWADYDGANFRAPLFILSNNRGLIGEEFY